MSWSLVPSGLPEGGPGLADASEGHASAAATATTAESENLAFWTNFKIMMTSLEYWLVALPFMVGLALFNAWTSLLALIMSPYGFSYEVIGILGAAQTGAAILSSIFISPIVDRWNLHVLVAKVS